MRKKYLVFLFTLFCTSLFFSYGVWLASRGWLHEGIHLGETGEYCEALEKYYFALPVHRKAAALQIGFLYARGDCVYQDFNKAELYFKQSENSVSLPELYFISANDILIRSGQPIADAQVMEKFKNLLVRSKSQGLSLNEEVLSKIRGLSSEGKTYLIDSFNDQLPK